MALLVPTRRVSAVVWGMLLLSAVAAVRAQTATESEVKAAFLYKFASFIEWPDEKASGAIRIGVFGNDVLEGALDRIVRGKAASGRGRAFSVHHLVRPEDARNCHIAFVAAPDRRRARVLLQAIGDAPVLTVGDAEGFAESGGVIGFEAADGRIRFAVNPDAAARLRLKLSSKLLSLARITRGGNPQ